jgi:hypothetical protein
VESLIGVAKGGPVNRLGGGFVPIVLFAEIWVSFASCVVLMDLISFVGSDDSIGDLNVCGTLGEWYGTGVGRCIDVYVGLGVVFILVDSDSVVVDGHSYVFKLSLAVVGRLDVNVFGLLDLNLEWEIMDCAYYLL